MLAMELALHLENSQIFRNKAKLAFAKHLKKQVQFIFPLPNSIVNRKFIMVKGVLQDFSLLSKLRINGAHLIHSQGKYWHVPLLLKEGKQNLVLKYQNRAFLLPLYKIQFHIDASPPKLKILDIQMFPKKREAQIKMEIKDSYPAEIRFAGKPIFKTSKAGKYNFIGSFPIQNRNFLEFEAKDMVGNTSKIRANLSRDPHPPELKILSPSPHARIYDSYVVLKGEIKDPSGISSFMIEGEKISLKSKKNSHWSKKLSISSSGLVWIKFEARDHWGNQKTIRFPLHFIRKQWKQWKQTRILKIHDQKIWGLCCPKKGYMATAGNDKKIHLLNIETWKIEATHPGYFVNSAYLNVSPAEIGNLMPIPPVDGKRKSIYCKRYLVYSSTRFSNQTLSGLYQFFIHTHRLHRRLQKNGNGLFFWLHFC